MRTVSLMPNGKSFLPIGKGHASSVADDLRNEKIDPGARLLRSARTHHVQNGADDHGRHATVLRHEDQGEVAKKVRGEA